MTDVPVTVLGGYLGAGKTTLLNHLLATATERIAVLVNDFGAINVDESLLESSDEDTIALTNGCICCSLVDGFAAALDQVRTLPQRPDRLVIEASGVADPAAVAAWAHGPGFQLDAVIVLADAEQLPRLLRNEYVGDVVAGQLRSADVVVITKVDLVDADSVQAVHSAIGQLTSAVRVEAAPGTVDTSWLLGDVDVRNVATRAADVEPGQPHRPWSHRFDPAPTDAELAAFLDALGPETIRVKGVLGPAPALEGRRIVHRVGHRTDVTRDDESYDGPSLLVGIDVGPAAADDHRKGTT